MECRDGRFPRRDSRIGGGEAQAAAHGKAAAHQDPDPRADARGGVRHRAHDGVQARERQEAGAGRGLRRADLPIRAALRVRLRRGPALHRRQVRQGLHGGDDGPGVGLPVRAALPQPALRGLRGFAGAVLRAHGRMLRGGRLRQHAQRRGKLHRPRREAAQRAAHVARRLLRLPRRDHQRARRQREGQRGERREGGPQRRVRRQMGVRFAGRRPGPARRRARRPQRRQAGGRGAGGAHAAQAPPTRSPTSGRGRPSTSTRASPSEARSTRCRTAS